MIRVKVKGTRIRHKSNPDEEPNFWDSMKWVGSEQEGSCGSVNTASTSTTTPTTPDDVVNQTTSLQAALSLSVVSCDESQSDVDTTAASRGATIQDYDGATFEANSSPPAVVSYSHSLLPEEEEGKITNHDNDKVLLGWGMVRTTGYFCGSCFLRIYLVPY